MPDIFNLALQKLREKDAQHQESSDKIGSNFNNSTGDSTIIICGSEDCGKSSLIQRFMDKSGPTSKTISMDYNYVIRMRNNNKEVATVWELGGGANMAKLIATPITDKTIESTGVMVFLDLRSPPDFPEIITQILTALHEKAKIIMASIDNVDPSRHVRLTAVLKKHESHKDSKAMKLLPFPLVFVAACFDQFQNFDMERKNMLYKFLRFVAHIHGADLLTHSTSTEALISKCKGFLAHFGFRDPRPSLQSNTDVMKPLYMAAGSDSFDSIGSIPGLVGAPNSYHEAITHWKDAFEEYFQSKDEKKRVSSSAIVADKQFYEYEIDTSIEQKKHQLEMLIREKENRRALADKTRKQSVQRVTKKEKRRSQPRSSCCRGHQSTSNKEGWAVNGHIAPCQLPRLNAEIREKTDHYPFACHLLIQGL
uniref:Cytoplasmic dynein 2 light intermediate chain 1 n=1 Tax=Panagrellus redivivus TaxID=6233 RepID=A0A7E5A150_PANRE